MNRNHHRGWGQRRRSGRAAGFTLIEIMVATAITLILMGSVAAMFGFVSTSVTDSRAMAETTERLRNVRNLLQHDLQGITAHGTPPLRPDQSLGYLEYIEGPVGPLWRPGSGYPGVPNFSNATLIAKTYGSYASPWDDCDDILMFTTRSITDPYVGRFYANAAGGNQWTTISSPIAEVAYFVRGTTLFRRVLLVLPNQDMTLLGSSPVSWAVPYYYSDISVHQEGGAYDPKVLSIPLQQRPIPALYANSLADLTKRENRYGHQPLAWPYDARFWNYPAAPASSSAAAAAGATSPTGSATLYSGAYACPNILGLPTLQECSSSNFPFPFYGPSVPGVNRLPTQAGYIPTLFGYYILPGGTRLSAHGDPRYNPYYMEVTSPTFGANPDPVQMDIAYNGINRWAQTDNSSHNTGGLLSSHFNANPPRFDDVLLTGVIGFDVKIWDPGAPVFQTTATVGGVNAPTSVAPGDPWYASALNNFNVNPKPTNTTSTLGAVGAYVDLNYMLAPVGNGITTTPTTYGVNYLNALNTYETNAGITSPTVPGIGTKYPAFVVPRPRFAFDGDQPIYFMSSSPTYPYPPFAYMGCPAAMHGIISGIKMNSSYSGNIASVFDTWSTHYESDGINQDQDQLIDEGTDGIDNPYTGGTYPMSGPWNNVAFGTNFIAGVDDPSELEAPPPYATACKGLQIRLRVIEPGSRQIREVTIVQELLDE